MEIYPKAMKNGIFEKHRAGWRALSTQKLLEERRVGIYSRMGTLHIDARPVPWMTHVCFAADATNRLTMKGTWFA